MKNCIVKITSLLAVTSVLSACRYEIAQPPEVVPPSPEEIAQMQLAEISSFANVSLYGDVLGYFKNSQEIERINTTCKGKYCGIGYVAYFGPESVNSVLFSDSELLGKQRNVNTLKATFKGKYIEANTYGGWLKYSFFGSHSDKMINEIDPDFGAMRVISFAVGGSTGENPKMNKGSAKWIGLMFGRDVRPSASRGQLLRGDAEITVKFDEAESEADVEFANIVELDTGTIIFDEMTWQDLALKNGGFSLVEAPDDYIRGQFFGPEAEEVGGIFERSNVAGSFGAKREAR
ncbi:MAG: transferrin-binding protein-like solute binding protein [Albidovulum sp.]|nr:transferrin-binding protein-like solute binding protein [Albidovulum sp.]MDE0533246.1 transferrin-binding protein-like solute binding protein [Albidovulum sp.]